MKPSRRTLTQTPLATRGPRGSIRLRGRHWKHLARNVRLSLAVTAMLMLAAVAITIAGRDAHARLVEDLGITRDNSLAGPLWLAPLSVFVQSSFGIGWLVMALILFAGFCLALLEWRSGPAAAGIVFFGSHTFASFLTLGLLLLMAELGSGRADAQLANPDTGVSAAAYGALAGWIFTLQGRLRLVAGSVLAAWLLASLWRWNLQISFAHCGAAAVAPFLVWLLFRMGVAKRRQDT